jgi:hypothetical protein
MGCQSQRQDWQDRSTLDIGTPVLYVNQPGWRRRGTALQARSREPLSLLERRSSEGWSVHSASNPMEGLHEVHATSEMCSTSCSDPCFMLVEGGIVDEQAASAVQQATAESCRVKLPFAGFSCRAGPLCLSHTHFSLTKSRPWERVLL